MRRRFGRAAFGRVVVDRLRLSGGLRLLSALSLLLLAGAVFWQPLTRIARPWAAPVLQRLPMPEVLRPKARGFMIRVVSQPSTAEVSIDGAARGSTPLFANVACKQDQEVTITVAKPGFSAWRSTVRCRVGCELTVRARLGAPRK